MEGDSSCASESDTLKPNRHTSYFKSVIDGGIAYVAGIEGATGKLPPQSTLKKINDFVDKHGAFIPKLSPVLAMKSISNGIPSFGLTKTSYKLTITVIGKLRFRCACVDKKYKWIVDGDASMTFKKEWNPLAILPEFFTM